jgi:hypothetical protein
MSDVIEVSYTGDLLAHRRCPRAWAYEKHAGFQPYEQVQAMEGRLIHHAMEWMTGFLGREGRHASTGECRTQLERHFRVLWARGMRTRFETKQETLDRVLGNLFPEEALHPALAMAMEGALHTEYEIRTIRQLVPARAGGKSRLLLTGILDLVVHQKHVMGYERIWRLSDEETLTGQVVAGAVQTKVGDEEIWDYKGSRASTAYLDDYARQMLTYAAIYRERKGRLPARCVLCFINEKKREEQFVTIPVDDALVTAALAWTHVQVEQLQATVQRFEQRPTGVEGGEHEKRTLGPGHRMSAELKQQCTTCGQRFDCGEYKTALRRTSGAQEPPDTDLLNVHKN